MSWIHCSCGNKLDYPNTKEILKDTMICSKCDEEHDTHVDKTDILVELFERVRVIENKLGIVPP